MSRKIAKPRICFASHADIGTDQGHLSQRRRRARAFSTRVGGVSW